MTVRLLAFLIWAAVAATAVFWGLRLVVQPTPAPAHAVAVGPPSADAGDLAPLLGAEAPAAEGAVPVAQTSDRFKLLGVVAPKPGAPPRVGVALIAVDDKPARAFRIGAPVDGRLVVQNVQARRVSLGPRGAPAEVELELPAQPPPSTGSLPPAPEIEPPEALQPVDPNTNEPPEAPNTLAPVPR